MKKIKAFCHRCEKEFFLSEEQIKFAASYQIAFPSWVCVECRDKEDMEAVE